MRAVVVAVVIALAACGFPPEPRMPKSAPLVAAPTRRTAKPLAIGQWATYREYVGSDDVGSVRFSVVEQAACGTWIRVELIGEGPQRSWRFCAAADHSITSATLDDEPVNVSEHARELASLLTRVLPPSFSGKFAVEETHVPAGHFFGALRVDAGTTTWLHPAVPLGAVVRVRQGQREDVLVAYGDSAPKPPASAARAKSCCHVPRYLELALGLGHLTGVASGETGSTMVLGWSFGTLVSPTIDFVVSAMGADSSQYSDTKSSSSTLITATGGVRVSPFRLHGGIETGLYVQALAGYASLRKGENDIVGNGIALIPSIGWQSLGGRDWSLGIQASDQLALLNRSVGFRQGLALSIAIDLWLR